MQSESIKTAVGLIQIMENLRTFHILCFQDVALFPS